MTDRTSAHLHLHTSVHEVSELCEPHIVGYSAAQTSLMS